MKAGIRYGMKAKQRLGKGTGVVLSHKVTAHKASNPVDQPYPVKIAPFKVEVIIKK